MGLKLAIPDFILITSGIEAAFNVFIYRRWL